MGLLSPTKESESPKATINNTRWQRCRNTCISHPALTALAGSVMFIVLLTTVICSVLFGSSNARYAARVKTVIDLEYSKYQGTVLPNGINQWLGIRYAAPPLGDLRFAAPQDPIESPTIILATHHGKVCLSTPGSLHSPGTSEDCLFLDVYAPSSATPSSKLPVYFFIQGGGFNTNASPNYNGSGLIEASGMNIVVVNFNYRVGPYGFLASSEIQSNASLNNGLKDQRKALEWVQKHISKFGGDPDHVVLGGTSAGAASITLQLVAYGGRDDGLFHASIAESQSFGAIRTVPDSQYQYDDLVSRTGCSGHADTLACLRGLDITFLQEQNIGTPFPGAENAPVFSYNPVLDHDFITDYTVNLFDQGLFIKLPGIYGDVTDEGTIFAPRDLSTLNQSDTFLHDQFPDLTWEQLGQINTMYPVAEQFPNSGRYWRQASNAYGEIRYVCPGIFLNNIYEQYGVEGNWNYRYNVADPKYFDAGYGVFHVAEETAVWGPSNTGAVKSSYTHSKLNANAVPTMQGYWTSFIRSYDPNTHRLEGTPTWEAWTKADKQRLLIVTNGTAMEKVDEAQQVRCEYLDSIAESIQQ